MKRSEINPNTIKCSKTWVYGPMGWTGCVRCEKFWHDFVARTFFTNCTVQPKLLCVLYNKKVISNAPEHNKTHQNMSLGSNRLDQVRSLLKFPTRHRGLNFCIIATVRPVLHRVLCCNETITNAPKHYNTHKNMSLGSNGLDLVRSLWKIPSQLHGTNFCTNCTSSTSLHHFSCGNETIQNAPKNYETHQNMCLGSNGVDRVPSLQKIPTRLRGMNFFH